MIQMFDDGSKAFKLLFNEHKDQDVKVYDVKQIAYPKNVGYLLHIFEKADPNHKVYLHYTADDLRANKEEKRREIEKVERVGFKNKIFLPYEGMDDKTVENRFRQLMVEHKPYVSETNERFKEDIKLTGKPIILDEPTKGFTINKTNEVKLSDEAQLDSRDNYIARRDSDVKDKKPSKRKKTTK